MVQLLWWWQQWGDDDDMQLQQQWWDILHCSSMVMISWHLTCQGYFYCHNSTSVAAAATAAKAAWGTTLHLASTTTKTTGSVCGGWLKTFLEVTVASQDALVEWALQEEEDSIDGKKEAKKEALTSGGDPYGPVLWPESLTAALAQCIMEALAADPCVPKIKN